MLSLKQVNGYQDIDWSSKNVQVLVSYTFVGDVKQAKYVYVIDQAGSNPSDDVTLNPATVKAAGIEPNKFVNNVVFSVAGTDSKGNPATAAVSNVVWYTYTNGQATKCDNLTQFASGVTYMAQFEVTAPLGVELKSVTSEWADATATLNGNTVTYQFTHTW